MKRFFSVLIIALIFSFLGCATMQADPEQVKSLDQVKEFPGIKKDVLYSKSISFIARKFNSANDVIQNKDQAAGQIICKGFGSVPDPLMGNSMPRAFSFTLIIDIKDYKMRTRFENIVTQNIGQTAGADMAFQWDDVKKYLMSIKTDLYSSISASKSDDNW